MWVPEIGEKYWFVVGQDLEVAQYEDCIEADCITYTGDPDDICRASSGCIGKTEEEAIRNYKRGELKIKVAKIAKRFPVDWEDLETAKEYCVYSRVLGGCFTIAWAYSQGCVDIIYGSKGFYNAVREELTEEELLLYVRG